MVNNDTKDLLWPNKRDIFENWVQGQVLNAPQMIF